MSQFGDIPIQIADGSAPSNPSSGVIVYSATGGVLSYQDNGGSNTVLTAPPTTTGSILVANGTSYDQLPIAPNGYVLVSTATTVSWTNPTPPIFGSGTFTSNSFTISDPSITTDSKIVVAPTGSAGAPILLASTNNGSFVLRCYFYPQTFVYIYQNPPA